MLRTPKNFKYDEFPAVRDSQYVISPNDMINFRVFTNNGFSLINVLDDRSGLSEQSVGAQGFQYLVEYDGTIKLPIIGRYKIAGLHIRAAEDSLEKLFSVHYNEPYVNLRVLNQRVTIFSGGSNEAKVVNMINQNMTLFEALASAGGVTNGGKAYKIKLIRGNVASPKIYLIDLSTIEGMKNADLILQAGDIIYVEPTERALGAFSREILPWVTSVISIGTISTTILILTRLNK
jgi:polysaccharide export outer membrane protein